MKKASAAQIKFLRSIAGKAFPDDAQYHDWLFVCFGKESTTELTIHEASEAIQLIQKQFPGTKSHTLKSDYQGYGQAGTNGNITPRQAHQVAVLECALGWTDNPARLAGFITRQTGKQSAVQMLSVKEAQKLITGLERILSTQKESA